MADFVFTTPMTYNQIVGMMTGNLLQLAQSEGNVDDTIEGSIALTLYESLAGPIEELMYRYHVDLPARFFIDQATGPALARLVNNITFGEVTQTQSTRAVGSLTFFGNPGAIISAGTTWLTDLGLAVTNDASLAIEVGHTSVVGSATALLAGTDGNLLAGTSLFAPNGITGITKAVVETTWTNGQNNMTDTELRQSVIDFFDSLFRGVKGAIVRGCRVNGYWRVFISVPLGGRAKIWVDDANPYQPAKLNATLWDLSANWVSGGIIPYLYDKQLHPITIVAQAFSDGTVTQAALEQAISAVWNNLLTNGKGMGDGLTLIELEQAAATVQGYNGVSIFQPAADLTVRAVLDPFNTVFGLGNLLPYEKLSLAAVTWQEAL
jgi:hypothetical protein